MLQMQLVPNILKNLCSTQDTGADEFVPKQA